MHFFCKNAKFISVQAEFGKSLHNKVAKIYKIDSGKEEWIDYERIIEILRTVNYNGNMSIVFEGQGNQVSDLEAIGLAVTYSRKLLAT